jgi:hypothetical protein
LSCPLIEDQEKLNRDAGRIFQQISTVIRFVRKPSNRHPDRQAGNFAGFELIGADRHIGRFSKPQLLFGVGSPNEILEPLLGKRRFPRIWSGRHKGIVIRTERCARGTRVMRAGSAKQTDQHDKKERAFHRVEFLKYPLRYGSQASHNGGRTSKDECRIPFNLRQHRHWGKSFLLFETDPHLCFSERIVIMEGNRPVKLLLNRFGIQPLGQARENKKPNANKRTTRGAIHLGIEKHQERLGIVSGDEPRRTTQFRSDVVFPDTGHQCEAEAVQKNIRTGSPSGILSPWPESFSSLLDVFVPFPNRHQRALGLGCFASNLALWCAENHSVRSAFVAPKKVSSPLCEAHDLAVPFERQIYEFVFK